MSIVTASPRTAALPAVGRRRSFRFGRLLATELRLVLREPIVLTFVFAFPALTVLILGGVFDPDDPAFEGIDPAHWFVAAYIGVVIAAIGLIMLPVHLAGYRQRGVNRRFRVSSFPAWALPLAHFVVGLAMTAIGIAVLLGFAALTYGIPPVTDLPGTLLGIGLGAATFTSIGVLIGTVVPTARSAQGLGMLLFFPSFLLGGGGPPPDAMGGAMRTVSEWVPLTHVVRAIQEPWLDLGASGDHLLVSAMLLLASTAIWVWRSPASS